MLSYFFYSRRISVSVLCGISCRFCVAAEANILHLLPQVCGILFLPRFDRAYMGINFFPLLFHNCLTGWTKISLYTHVVSFLCVHFSVWWMSASSYIFVRILIFIALISLFVPSIWPRRRRSIVPLNFFCLLLYF